MEDLIVYYYSDSFCYLPFYVCNQIYAYRLDPKYSFEYLDPRFFSFYHICAHLSSSKHDTS